MHDYKTASQSEDDEDLHSTNMLETFTSVLREASFHSRAMKAKITSMCYDDRNDQAKEEDSLFSGDDEGSGLDRLVYVFL